MKKITHLVFFTILPVIACFGSCSSSNNSTDDGTGGDTDVDTDADGDADADTDDDSDTDTDDFDECTSVNESAQNTFQPLDIIFTIDNSPSLLDEINEVRENMNAFSDSIIETGLDVHIILISCLPEDCGNDNFHGICIDAPLGAEGGCPEGGPYDDTNLPKYLHVSERVPSVKGLEWTIDTYDQWKDMIRPNSVKHFVVVSDDTDETLPAEFIDQLVALDPMFEDFQFNGIFAYMSKDEACAISEDEPCCTYAAPEGQAPDWTVYETLVAMTEGVSGDLCLQDFDPVFEELAISVIESAQLNCEWTIPDPPEDMTLDPNLVNLVFIDGNGIPHIIGRVPSLEACDNVEHGWYYDDPENPTMIHVCPDTCTWIQGDENAEIIIEFGCETEDAVPT